MVRKSEPAPPSRLRPGLSRDLEAIALKCLEKAPARRYRSAAELADDLDRWLRGEPTRARPPGLTGRGWRMVRRHPRTSAAVILAFLLPLVGVPIWYRFNPQRPVWEMEGRLRRGETVTLIGKSGPPAWSRWELRQGGVVPSPWGADTFTISSLEPALLVLLRDPQGGYKFRARVRHDQATRLGEVGLHFVHSLHNTEQGANHCYCKLIFSDREALHEDPQTKAPCSQVRCELWRSQPGGTENTLLLAGHYFRPAVLDGPNEYPWRELAVEVRPDGLELFWEGQSFAHVSHQTIRESFPTCKLGRVGLQMVDCFPDLHPAFTPRDALGLYVNRSKASYQHVVVQPLP
jgi:serine/threonine-protein kinase